MGCDSGHAGCRGIRPQQLPDDLLGEAVATQLVGAIKGPEDEAVCRARCRRPRVDRDLGPLALDLVAAAGVADLGRVRRDRPGAAADQPAGTDIPPTEDAEPIPASVAPPTPPTPAEDAPASVVPKPKPAPSGAVSLMVTPNGAMESMWPSIGSVALIIEEFQASVTPTL